MNMIDIILKKRDGFTLTKEEIDFFVQGVTKETFPDYQASAFLMAIYFSSLNAEETANLTMSMVHSGTTFDLSSLSGFKVDKHSTGGVADTTTLILAPLVASLGVPVVKMSGRGLGFSGGTLDKLDAIPNLSTTITQQQALSYAQQSHIVIMGQTENLTPADKKLYALRDVTGTVESLPLIASSIMSKKIAAGADGIVLDVKCGSGAFMKDLESARNLAYCMVEIGKNVGRKVTAVISSMEQPLGQNIGNSLEVIEAMEILKGNVAGNLLEVSLTLGAYMLQLAGKVSTTQEGKDALLMQIKNGAGLKKWKEFIIQQGGNPAIIEDYSLLPLSKETHLVLAKEDGYVFSMNTAEIGHASVVTGAGRLTKEQPIDLGAGIIMKKQIGDAVKKGDTLAVIHSSSKEKSSLAGDILASAITIRPQKPSLPQLVLDVISQTYNFITHKKGC